MAEIERRVFLSEVEVRSAGENQHNIVGYAYKFNARSQNLGGFKETILDGAGAESIKTDDIRALVNHDPNLILGRNMAGTLRVAEDSTGLHYEINADERVSYVRDLLISLERGDVTQSSFGFQVNPDGETWTRDTDDFPLRSVSSLRLFDVSPVTYPAYLTSEAVIGKRCLDMAAALSEQRSELYIPDPEPLSNRLALFVLRG